MFFIKKKLNSYSFFIVFFLQSPNENEDSYFRKFQHIYAIPLYFALYISWRKQSLFYIFNNNNNIDIIEILLIVLHYSIFTSIISWYVFFGSIAIGGFFVAVIVTASHQSEDFYHPEKREKYDFIKAQFTTTRDAQNNSWLAKWFWGGMDTQLEHHLFPLIPQYYYHSLVPIVQQFAKENNLEYRSEPAWDLLKRNFNTLQNFATQ